MKYASHAYTDALMTSVDHESNIDLLNRLHLPVACGPWSCIKHGLPPLNHYCATCKSTGVNFCSTCLTEHASSHPGHELTTRAFNLSVSKDANVQDLRKQLWDALAAKVSGCCAADGAPTECFKSHTPPLVFCARHKTIAIHAELDRIASQERAALDALASNRDKIVAATWDIYASQVDVVAAAVASLRVALETELVTADAALERSLEVTDQLTEVRSRAITICSANTLLSNDQLSLFSGRPQAQ